MVERFCTQCGTRSRPGDRFCAQCGTAFEAASASPARWQVTGTGLGVLGGSVALGLATWVAILSPAPPKPAPGGAAPKQSASSELPAGHPDVPLEIPAQVKSAIAELKKKAEAKPDDLSLWEKLGEVAGRAAQFDASYGQEALAAYRHVLEKNPKNDKALHGIADLLYDRKDAKAAIPYYEQYLALRPDDLAARTSLADVYFFSGDANKALTIYRDVLKRDSKFLQARYNLAVTLYQQGDKASALAELKTARGIATDDDVRGRIDDLIANLSGERPAAPAEEAQQEARTPFQRDVEEAFRQHQIMGPKISGFTWSGPTTGRVLMREFPMEAMPPAVREKFATRLAETLRAAQDKHHVAEAIKVEIADAATGAVMATVTP